MPGRPFDPAMMPTQRLKDLAHQLVTEIAQLEDDYTRKFQLWCHLGIINAPQTEEDIAQGVCRTARRMRTRAYNKRSAVMREIMNRDMAEQRALEDSLR